MDNLTIVIVTFDNLEIFLADRPKPTRLENHLFQIKEVESGATSTIVQPTPALTDSAVTGMHNLSSVVISPGRQSTSSAAIAEEEPVTTEEQTEEQRFSFVHQERERERFPRLGPEASQAATPPWR